MSEALRLLFAQVDDVPGEQMAHFIEQAVELGARNVQVVPSLTKKGRPGHLVFLDVPAALETEAALLLGAELGTWGYRVLAAEHRHFDISRFETDLEIVIGGSRLHYALRAKIIADGGRVLRVKAEHDDLVAISSALRTLRHQVPLAVLKAATESALYAAEQRSRISIAL